MRHSFSIIPNQLQFVSIKTMFQKYKIDRKNSLLNTSIWLHYRSRTCNIRVIQYKGVFHKHKPDNYNCNFSSFFFFNVVHVKAVCDYTKRFTTICVLFLNISWLNVPRKKKRYWHFLHFYKGHLIAVVVAVSFVLVLFSVNLGGRPHTDTT